MSHIRALSEDTEEKLFSGWHNIIQSGECGSTFFYPISGSEYRMSDFFQWLETKNLNKPAYINLGTTSIEEKEDVQKILKDAKYGIVIKSAEKLLRPNHRPSFHTLLEANNIYKLGIIFVFEGFIYDIFHEKDAAEFHSALQKIGYFPLLNLTDTKQFAIFLKHKYGWSTDAVDIAKIHKETGGHTWLIKGILREITTSKYESIIASDQYTYRTKTIFSLLSKRHKKVLNELITSDVTSPSESIQELKNLGFLQESKGRYVIPDFIVRQLQIKADILQIKGKKIVKDNVDISAYFSIQEILFLSKLSQSSDDYVTRQDVASAIWPSGDYTDWSFDQLVKRVRRKLEKLGISPRVISVKRGRGVKICQEL